MNEGGPPPKEGGEGGLREKGGKKERLRNYTASRRCVITIMCTKIEETKKLKKYGAVRQRLQGGGGEEKRKYEEIGKQVWRGQEGGEREE